MTGLIWKYIYSAQTTFIPGLILLVNMFRLDHFHTITYITNNLIPSRQFYTWPGLILLAILFRLDHFHTRTCFTVTYISISILHFTLTCCNMSYRLASLIVSLYFFITSIWFIHVYFVVNNQLWSRS